MSADNLTGNVVKFSGFMYETVADSRKGKKKQTTA